MPATPKMLDTNLPLTNLRCKSTVSAKMILVMRMVAVDAQEDMEVVDAVVKAVVAK